MQAPPVTAAPPTDDASPRRGRAGRAVAALAGLITAAVLIAQIPVVVSLFDTDVQFEAGHAKPVLLANALAAAVTALAAAVLPRRLRALALLPGGALAAAMLAASLTVGGHLWDCLAALLTLAGAWWAGRLLLRRLAVPPLRDLAPAELVLGLALLGMAVLLAGRLGVIAWWSVGLLTIAFGAVGIVRAGAGGWQRRQRLTEALTASPLATACAGLLLLQAGWAIVWLSAPEIMFDPLYGKAYLPQLWAESGSIGPLIEHPVLNIAGLMQIVATPGHALDAADVGRWLQLLVWAALVVTVWWWGGRRSAVGPLAALAVGIAPHLVWQSTTAYDDLALAFGAVALTLAVLRSARPPGAAASGASAPEPTFATALAIGLLAGACVWLKLNLAVLTVVLAVGWIAVAGARVGLPRRFAGVALGGVLVAAPALVLRWIDTGNPVFPSYNTLFKSSHYPLVNEQFNFPFWPDASLLDILKVPYEAIARPVLMDEGSAAGAFGLLVAATLVALAIGWRGGNRRATAIAWCALVVSLLAWWVQFRYLRYAVPSMLVAVLLVVAALREWRPGRLTGLGLLAAVAAASALYLPSTVASFWNVPHRDVPFAAAFGRWDERAYLRTIFPERDALEAFERLSPPGANAISEAGERVWVADRDLSPLWEVKRAIELGGPEPADGDEALRRLSELGIGWVLVTGPLRTTVGEGWFQQLLAQHGELAFSDRGWDLYRLAEQPAAARLSRCDDDLRGAGGCWSGTLDRVPGLADGESAGGATRPIPVCPGQLVSVRVTTAPGGQPALVELTANHRDSFNGYTNGVVAAGTTERIGLTVPDGASAVTVRIVPGASGGEIDRAEVGTLGRCSAP